MGGSAGSSGGSASSGGSGKCQTNGTASQNAQKNGQQAGNLGINNKTCTPQALNCAAPNESGVANPCNNTIIQNYLNPVINFLSLGVGILVVISMAIGGLQYITSAGDPNKAAEARKRITDSVIALVAFALMYAVLQFFVPGGFLNGASSNGSSSASSSSSSSVSGSGVIFSPKVAAEIKML
ncbi:MAG: hypothetical protein ACREGA_04105 [Candidatus Saccharimonadales bacterium]